VGLFDVPVEIAIATAGGTRSFPIRVSKAEENFNFSVDGPPLLVLFDKGSKILKSVEFRKSPIEWTYQLQKAEEAVDRAAAAEALGNFKGNDAVVAALGDAALRDPFWGVKVQALAALGKVGGPEAAKRVLAAVANTDPWVREVAVEQLGNFKDDAALAARLAEISRNDSAYRVRTTALGAYAQLKPAGGLAVLNEATRSDSPDDVIRRAALRAMGTLGDDKAVSTLFDWSQEGKPIGLRTVAISSVAQLDEKNGDITRRLIAYLDDPAFDIRTAAVSALGDRDDPAAIAPLEAMLKRTDLSVNFPNVIERQLTRLRHTENDPDAPAPPAQQQQQPPPQGRPQGGGAAAQGEVLDRLGKLEQSVNEVNDRLRRIEQALPAKASQ
jgi:HEAT repeat protein